MKIEDSIFERKTLIESKLSEFGFRKKDSVYIFEKEFLNRAFKAVVTVDQNKHISGKVIDLDADDEYVLVHVEEQTGAFVSKVRNAYIRILREISDKCFKKEIFLSPQSNRIASLIKEIYGELPDFPFKKFPAYGVFRYKPTNKWYALVMNIKRGKLDKDCNKEHKDDVIEIINLKVGDDYSAELLKTKGIFPSYHMKNNWITIILDGTLEDGFILKLLDISRGFALGGKSKNKSGNQHWIIPANPSFFDVFEYFSKNKEVIWKQTASLYKGDIAYIYVTSPVSEIRYKCEVIEPDMPYDYKDNNLSIKKAVKLKVLGDYPENFCSIKKMRELGVKAIRGQRSATDKLIDYLN